jgi:hypothetical protein
VSLFEMLFNCMEFGGIYKRVLIKNERAGTKWAGMGLHGTQAFTPIPDQCSKLHQMSIGYLVWGMMIMW